MATDAGGHPGETEAEAKKRVRLGIALGIAMALMAASSFSVARGGILRGVRPEDITLLRFGVAGLIFLPVLIKHGVANLGGIGWGRGLVLVLTTVPIFASILRVPFAAVAPMIVVSCAIGAYAIQNAMFDIWLMLGFGVVGYVFKKIGIPLAPFTLALVLGNRAEDAFRLSMIGSGGDMKVFWSNGLVGSITTLAILLLFWPVIDKAFGSLGRLRRPAKVSG